MKTIVDPVKGKTVPVFFFYSVPSVLSMMAISCAIIVDGFFIGNYGGVTSLAAVNLTIPVNAFLVGIAMMLSVGGAARCGFYLGKRDKASADAIFTLTVIIMVIIALSASLAGMIFTDPLVRILGANAVIHQPTAEYLRIMLLFYMFTMGIVCLSCFLRLDGRPLFAAGAMTAGSLLNVILDWLFIVKLNMGHSGAALGTGLSELAAFIVMCMPFLMKQTRLRFNPDTSKLSEAFKAACTGFSEFSNEVSAGMITLVFNWVVMKELGETGVVAFSVINYIILCGIIINCGISEAIQPIVSKNYGAKKPGRIINMLGISTISVFAIGVVISSLLLFFPEAFTAFFIKNADSETVTLTNTFIACIWPVFLLNGINIVLTSYLTAMNRAVHSTVVSLARNLFLPALFIMVLPSLTGNRGIFISLPLAELVTFFIAMYLLNRNTPARLIAKKETSNKASVT